MVEDKRTEVIIEYPPCSKRSEEFLYDVGSREFGLNVLQGTFLNIFNAELWTGQGCRQSTYLKYLPLMPKNTLNEGNMAAVISLRNSPLDHFQLRGAKKPPCL